jgi:hypothetical protein
MVYLESAEKSFCPKRENLFSADSTFDFADGE